MIVRRPTAPRTMWEILGLRAGIKPVAFVTVEPEREGEVRAQLEGFEVIGGTRAVRIAGGDRWGAGAGGAERAVVELFASRGRERARLASELQREDPTRHLRALGALLGYPECCIEAFAAQRERSDNSANRRQTAERTGAAMPWRWELRNGDRMIAAFFPCSYVCELALVHARAILARAEEEEPGIAARIERELRGVLVYRDHDRQIGLEDATLDGARCARFARATVPWSGGDEWDRVAETIAAGAGSEPVDLSAAGDAAIWVFGGA